MSIDNINKLGQTLNNVKIDVQPQNALDLPTGLTDTTQLLPDIGSVTPLASNHMSDNGHRTPGDEILISLQRVSDAQGNNISNINNTLVQMNATDSITIADTLKLQKLLIDYQITQDLISKGADKISQGTQTLFRNQ